MGSIIHSSLMRAARTDPANGVQEVAEFRDLEGSRVYCYSHVPTQPPMGGVLICSPLHAEFARNYRREVILGRTLALHGIAVHRFHYRGVGNSEARIEPTFESMRADAIAAAEWFKQGYGLEQLAVLGTRCGGFVAGSVATEMSAAPVALWEPIIDPVDYFREAFRSRLIRDLKEGGHAATESTDELLEVLRRDGCLDVLGYSISAPLYDSFLPLNLQSEMGTQPRAILLVQLGRNRRLRDRYTRLIQVWRSEGFQVDSHSVDRTEAWWFVGGTGSIGPDEEGSASLFGRTVDWLARQFQ